MASIEKGIYVTTGSIDGTSVRCKSQLKYIPAKEAKELEAFFSEHLLKIECDNQYSYDNSDDDRASCYSSSYRSVKYGKVHLEYDSEALLYIDGELRGVVFRKRSRSGRDVDLCPFLFDGSCKGSMRLGHSASHSSDYRTVESVTLVKEGEDGAPESAGHVNFSPNEMYTDI